MYKCLEISLKSDITIYSISEQSYFMYLQLDYSMGSVFSLFPYERTRCLFPQYEL